jgi:hypothetical protein
VYNAALEQDALNWASTCPTPANAYDMNATDGENVFFLNQSPPYTGDIVTQLWAAEASNWNCLPDSCTDQVTKCRDFRQIIWSSSTQMGCAAVSNCPGAFPIVYVCRYRAAGNIVGQHPLANPSLQCPLDGIGGSCPSTTSSSSTSGSTSTGVTTSTSTATTTATTSPTAPPTIVPTYPPSCSAVPTPVTIIRPPQTRVRFAFDGMLNGVCDTLPAPTPAPCPGTCGVISPSNIQVRAASLVL